MRCGSRRGLEYRVGQETVGKEKIHLEINTKIDMICVGRANYLISKAMKGIKEKTTRKKKIEKGEEKDNFPPAEEEKKIASSYLNSPLSKCSPHLYVPSDVSRKMGIDKTNDI